ncbi:hypothetical protein B0H10DRAFT_2042557 [Mycena sp. CBHHK59/15]|nr:hypothetical protein B0H10DRAFT_2042557 [Mycena sp. CBHHK59/15]
MCSFPWLTHAHGSGFSLLTVHVLACSLRSRYNSPHRHRDKCVLSNPAFCSMLYSFHAGYCPESQVYHGSHIFFNIRLGHTSSQMPCCCREFRSQK